jgi:Flp pilus assembly pilin Flp
MAQTGRTRAPQIDARGTNAPRAHHARAQMSRAEGRTSHMSLSMTRVVAARLLTAERGQGTVEYVGIVLAVAALLVAVAAAIDNKVGGPIATALVHKLQDAVTQVGNAKHS